MHRLAISLVLVVACGGKSKPGATSGSGSGSQALYAKKISVGWGIQPADRGGANVFLSVTDDTGRQTSYPLGTYPGECKKTKPAPEMKAVTAVACTAGASGVELDATVSGDEIVVIKVPTQQGSAPDPMTGVEVTRVAAPGGAAVVVGE
jgi:hypothetical protein